MVQTMSRWSFCNPNFQRNLVPAFLLMNAGANSGARFELDPNEVNKLGRDWQCQIVLNDPQCSRIHAKVFKNEDGWWISDNGSSNGTFVNGQTIDQARLGDGTELRVGSCSFTFSLNETIVQVVNNEAATTNHTIVLDQSMDPRETGQYTLNFLKGHNWGQDFFFLFQLSVKLLGIDDPESVIAICMRRLFDRTNASAAGFLWLTEEGKLHPKIVFPQDQSDNLQINDQLTKRVVKQKRAIRARTGVIGEVC